jgi:hypothetical protein
MSILTQLVRPMVYTQTRLLAQSQEVRSTMVHMLVQWLGYLGVSANVTSVAADSGQIHVCLKVERPQTCEVEDWHTILDRIGQAAAGQVPSNLLSERQHRDLEQLLVYLIRSGYAQEEQDWQIMQSQLQTFGIDERTLLSVRDSLSSSPSLNVVLDELDSDVAAIALPIAARIARVQHHMDEAEETVLDRLLQLVASNGKRQSTNT